MAEPLTNACRTLRTCSQARVRRRFCARTSCVRQRRTSGKCWRQTLASSPGCVAGGTAWWARAGRGCCLNTCINRSSAGEGGTLCVCVCVCVCVCGAGGTVWWARAGRGCCLNTCINRSSAGEGGTLCVCVCVCVWLVGPRGGQGQAGGAV